MNGTHQTAYSGCRGDSDQELSKCRAMSLRSGSARGFTLLELLVVIVVISILVGAVLTASSLFINDARVKNTRAVLLVVRDALDQFKNDQSTKPTVTRIVQGTPPNATSYAARYGMYPPDELEVFSPYGLPGASASGKYSLAGPGTNTQPPATESGAFREMRFHRTGDDANDVFEHRDLAAMVLAIQLFSESADQILSRIPERNWTAGVLNNNGRPAQFLDRPPLGSAFVEGDEQIRYIVDDWGMPLSYLAQRDFVENVTPPNRPAPASSNHRDWNRASTEMIRLNGGQPLVFSYGPDGKEQLSANWMKANGEASLIVDWAGTGNPHRIDHPLNADNVYPDAGFNEKMAKGSQ